MATGHTGSQIFGACLPPDPRRQRGSSRPQPSAILHRADEVTASDQTHRPIAQRYDAIPGSPEAGHLAALKALWHLAYREASTLAFADAFHAIMLAFIAATLLVPLLRQVTPAKAPAADAH